MILWGKIVLSPLGALCDGRCGRSNLDKGWVTSSGWIEELAVFERVCLHLKTEHIVYSPEVWGGGTGS